MKKLNFLLLLDPVRSGVAHFSGQKRESLNIKNIIKKLKLNIFSRTRSNGSSKWSRMDAMGTMVTMLKNL